MSKNENYFMLDGKKIEMSKETYAKLKESLVPEETYKVGDILRTKDKLDEVLIVGLDNNEVCFAGLSGPNCKRGKRWNYMNLKVDDRRRITKKELRLWSYNIWEKV